MEEGRRGAVKLDFRERRREGELPVESQWGAGGWESSAEDSELRLKGDRRLKCGRSELRAAYFR